MTVMLPPTAYCRVSTGGTHARYGGALPPRIRYPRGCPMMTTCWRIQNSQRRGSSYCRACSQGQGPGQGPAPPRKRRPQQAGWIRRDRRSHTAASSTRIPYNSTHNRTSCAAQLTAATELKHRTTRPSPVRLAAHRHRESHAVAHNASQRRQHLAREGRASRGGPDCAVLRALSTRTPRSRRLGCSRGRAGPCTWQSSTGRPARTPPPCRR